MREAREDSLPAARTSNRAGASLLRYVARACRETAASRRGDRSAIETVLALAVEATRTERAFVARPETSCAGTPLIEAYFGPADRRTGPSRTVVRLVATRARPLISTDVRADDRLREGESVRALELRRVLATAIPGDVRGRILVLDGRTPTNPQLPASLADALDGFAALVGLTLPRTPADTLTDPAVRADLPVPCSEAMREALIWADRVARTDLPVLVRGETGAGKEVVARRIHARSRRAAGPMLAINCAALPETLLEAELFGSVRGAYTGADRDRTGLFRLAHGGTLLLDEIGEMTPSMQAKLLRALEDRRIRPIGAAAETEADVRVVAATHRDLGRLVDRGEFRLDLFHRIAVLEVRVPPLRERIADLRTLVAELAPGLARDTGLGLPRIDDDAWPVLESHGWPGNVRELRAVIARAMLRADPLPVRARHLGEIHRVPSARACGPTHDASLERRMIVDALRAADGVIARAAADIGWSRQKLQRRIGTLGIERGEP